MLCFADQTPLGLEWAREASEGAYDSPDEEERPARSRRAPLATIPDDDEFDEDNPLIREYERVGQELAAQEERRQEKRRGVVPGTVTSDSGWTPPGFRPGRPAWLRSCRKSTA
jgi:hypothetical protein